MAEHIVPLDRHTVQRFSKNDPRKLKGYLLMLAAFLEGKPINTRRTYACAIRQFFDLFDWMCPEDVSAAHAVAFKKWLLEHKGVSESTTYYRLSAMSSLFDYLCMPPSANEEPLLRSNPFKLVGRNDIKPTPYARATAMEWSTFKKILDTIPADEIGLRDKAILIFFAFTGRRRSEVANLRIRDINFNATPITYTVRVKGGAIRSFELPEICFDAMRAYWIASDRLNDLRPDSGVFTPTRNCHLTRHLDPEKPLSNRSMNEILARSALRADIQGEEIRIHALRHMAARDLDRAGLRLQDIQQFLGHMNPNTTQMYLDRLSGPAPAHQDALIRVRDAAAELAAGLMELDSEPI